MRILAGDVGGTKTALALYVRTASGYDTVRQATYASADHASLEAVLHRFFEGAAVHVDAAAFGVAGPVRDGVCTTTNLPWTISEAALAASLHAPTRVVNDMHTIVQGALALDDTELCMLNARPRDPTAPIALIAPGTGLGEAIAFPTSTGLHVIAGEGGHADFAPNSEIEIRLLQFLSSRYAHVSWERVASGLGLADIYDFVVADGLAAADPRSTARFATDSKNAVIGEHGLLGHDAAAVTALTLFVSILGAEAGNLALRVLPRGGLYVAGGIAKKLLPRLSDGTFMASFLAKGRMSKILESIPVAVVQNDHVGLLGARACAALSLES